MNKLKATLYGSIALTASSLATPALAFFGPVCIPTPANCGCTYMVPCPVTDSQSITEAMNEIEELKAQLETLENITDPQQMFMMALRGEGSFAIPGFSSIGIDLNGLIAGDLSGLGLPAGIDINMVRSLAEGDIGPGTFMSLANAAGVDTSALSDVGLTPATIDAIARGEITPEAVLGVAGAMGITPEIAALSDSLSSIGLSEDMIGSLATGELSPNMLIEAAASAGIDLPTLSSLGLSVENMEALASGSLPTPDVLSLAQNLGLQGNVLRNIGIDESLIEQVANGTSNIDTLLARAESAGLSQFDLASVGLDQNTLNTLAGGASPEAVMGILQRTGFDRSPLSSLGIDATLLGQIASGQVSPEAISLLASQAGLDPSAIIVPGANGAIKAPGSSSGRAVESQNFMTIPVSSVPGLENVLNRARGVPTNAITGGDGSAPGGTTSTGAGTSTGTGTGDATGTGTGTETGALADSSAIGDVCAPENLTLISTQIAPNAFGDDVTNIDMAIATGDLEAFEEAVDAVDEANTETAAFGFARAVTTQNVVVAALQSIEAFEQMASNTTTLQDDFLVNDTIAAQLMSARAETASMLTAVISMKAAQKLNRDIMAPVPLFPQDSRFQELVEETITRRSEEEREQAEELHQVSADHSQFIRDSREAAYHHSLVADAIQIAEGMPAVRQIILDHEELKAMQASLEEVIKGRLAQLYHEPLEAWDLVREALYAEAGNYLDPNKYEAGFEDAKALSRSVTALADQTSFGDRIYRMTTDEDGRTEKRYSVASETPFAYAEIDANGQPLDEPYRIMPRSSLLVGGGRDDPPYMPQGYEMVGAFQYYLELVRRNQFMAEMRRGESEVSMTNRFWNELITNASQCIVGPFDLTEETLIKRPEMFDLSPDCDHLTWSYGDPEDYIYASELGGADAALWISKITLDQTQRRTGGPDQVMADIAALLTYAEENDLGGRLEELGLGSSAAHLEEILSVLEGALQLTDFVESFDIPRVAQ